MELNYAIVFVSDMKRSVAFYRETVGLPLRFESTHWTEFETGGTTLALHWTEIEASEPGAAGARARSAAGSCRPGFRVADLDAFHRRMLDRQVPCLQEPRMTFGVRIAQYSDPDELSFSVSEPPGGVTSDGG